MDREISTGLQLDQPRLLLQEDRAVGRGLFYGLLMLLGGLGGWGCLITAFGLEVYSGRLIATAIVCCAFAVWRQLDAGRRRRSLSLAGWVIWLLILVFSFDSIAHGAVRTVNLMLDCYGTKLNYSLPSMSLPYQAGTRNIDPVGECTSFISVLFFPFFWSMARMWVKSRNNRGPFGLTGMLLLLPMSFSILPAGWAFGTLILFWCMLLMLAPTLGGPEGGFGHKGRKGYRASGVGAARPLALMLAIGVGLCMWAVYLYAPPDTYKRPELAESLRTGVREGFGSSQYLRGGQGNSSTQVQLSGLGMRAYTGETMLRVKFNWQDDPLDLDERVMEPIENMYPFFYSGVTKTYPAMPANSTKEYLKSFVGSVYTGESWERLGMEDRERANKLALTAQNQTARLKSELHVPSRDGDGWYELSVQNLGTNPRCVYIPSSLMSGEEELEPFGIELAEDGYAKSGNFINGTREYSLSAQARTYGTNYFSRVVGHLAYQRLGLRNISDLGSAAVGGLTEDPYAITVLGEGRRAISLGDSSFISTPAEFLDLFDSINSQGNIGGKGWPADLWTVPDYAGAWELLSVEQQELLRAVEEYNAFVYEHYTQVPEELKGFLDDFQEAYDLDPLMNVRHGAFQLMDGVEVYAARIAAVFQKYFTYSLDPPAAPRGEDFVEYFLSESHEGYCVHFASAAVMLLRAAGYPARYAEGYVVPSAPVAQGGYWLDVPDYNAHAWVEVYCGGTGWIPVEVTPAALDNPASFYDATMPENPEDYIPTPLPEEARPTMPPRNDPLIDEQLQSPTPRASAPAASPSPGTNGQAGSGKTGSWLLTVLWALSAAIGIGGAAVLQRILRIRKRERDLSQRDRNAAGLKAYGYLLRLYEKEAFCGERTALPERWKELAEKARFSAHELSAEELGELVGDAERLREKLRRELPRGQKAWCWLNALI